MNERGRVEVPENAVRSEPIAFGLSAVQLLICGAGVLLAAALNLLPLWLPLKLVLLAVVAAPVLLAAILPIGGEPAYRWLVRTVRYLRSPRVWQAELTRLNADATNTRQAGAEPRTSGGQAPDKSEISGGGHDGEPALPAGAGADRAIDQLGSPPHAQDAMSDTAPGAREQRSMGDRIIPFRVAARGDPASEPPESDPAGEPPDRPAVVPHVLPGLRIACFLAFAGGVGKTTLAVETATHIAAHARYRTLDGDEHPLRVLLLDASRVTAGAAGIRLGLDGAALSRALNPARWHHPSVIEDVVVATQTGVDLAIVPAHPSTSGFEVQPEAERELFRSDHVDDLLEGARAAGYQLLIVDAGSHLEDGHRHLLDRADLVLGVVRPTLESLPDVHRLASLLRGMGAGRKLTLVANLADDDGAVRAHAHDADLPVAGMVPSDPAFVAACERGEPAWTVEPALEPAIRGVAAAIWPLLAADATDARARGLRRSGRRLATLRRGSAR